MNEEGFDTLIQELSQNLHDSSVFLKLREAMATPKKTRARRELLGPKLTREPISFDAVKDRWEENNYSRLDTIQELATQTLHESSKPRRGF